MKKIEIIFKNQEIDINSTKKFSNNNENILISNNNKSYGTTLLFNNTKHCINHKSENIILPLILRIIKYIILLFIIFSVVFLIYFKFNKFFHYENIQFNYNNQLYKNILTNPIEISSVNGILDTTLVIGTYYYKGPFVSFKTRAYNNSIPAPTLRLSPGIYLYTNYLYVVIYIY